MAGSENLQEVTLRRISLCDRAISHFKGIDFADPTVSFLQYLDFIKKGEWVLYGIFEGSNHVGSFACVIERGDVGSEFFIALGGSEGQGRASLKGILPLLEGIAKDSGCMTIRTTTAIPALVRLYESAGYDVSEYVIRKFL